MKITKDFKKKLGFNPKKCNDLYIQLIETFQKHKPTVGESIIALGNTMYALGASIGGFKDVGPSPEEVEKLYYQYPDKIEYALMAQAMIICSWFSSWEQQLLENQTKEGDKDEKPNL